MRRSSGIIVVTLLSIPLLLGASRRRGVTPQATLDMRRSFAVTDFAILDGFSFERVMNALVERSGVRGMTATQLFQQWLDTQNRKPGLVNAETPHCDDFLVDGKPSFNGFPRRCPTTEGALATGEPFVPAQFIPLAIINRFDLAATDGSHCGQYRLIYARKTAQQSDVLHFIFEGVLRNPSPTRDLAGCRDVAQFWADLSAINSTTERRARLETFFFTGLPGFAPVVDPGSYSRASGGGIRSFHYSPSAGGKPQFYQFRLEKTCAESSCQLMMEPDVLQNMPMGNLFDAKIQSEQGLRFRENFIQQVETLAISDRNRFFMDVPREFLIAESDPVDGEPAFLFLPSFFSGLVTPDGQEFSAQIADELKRVGSSLTPTDLVYRAQTQNCYGCHAAGVAGIRLTLPPVPPPTAILQHISERFQEQGEAGQRYSISPAMRDQFLPHRMDVLRNFLTFGAPPGTNAETTLGGGRSVQ
jgi:hypothetical protein